MLNTTNATNTTPQACWDVASDTTQEHWQDS